MSHQVAPQANIGVVGLAVMGSNPARNLASREGNTVAVYNRSAEKTRDLVTAHPEAGFVASESIEESPPRSPSLAPRSSWSKPVPARMP